MTAVDTLGGRAYLGAVILAGVLTVLSSLYDMSTTPVRLQWFVLAGLTLLSGSFTVGIPGIPAHLSVSETFVFAAVLLFGPSAATVIVVLDSLVIQFWLGRRARATAQIVFNTVAPALAIWLASHLYYWLAGGPPLAEAPRPILSLVPPLLALAAVYFLLNSWLVALAVGFDKKVSALAIWRKNFLWLSVNYFSGASVAALLLPYLYPEQSGFVRMIAVLLPLLVISYITLKTMLGRVDDANRHLVELNRLYLSTIETLAMAIDAKDQITHGHIRRVQLYAVGLAKAIGVTEDSHLKAIEAAALLHDMGKLAVPEYILNKPGPLTPAEFEKMKLHASVGADILSAIDFPYPVVPIVRHHHESWDGSGYPDGLRGTNIPIGARILSVVDCFDALTSDRPYRPRLSDRDALRILEERRGTMYDPLVVDTFARVYAELAPTLTATSRQPFAAITEAATTARPQLYTRTQPLDDIAASSEEMLTLFTLARELTGRMSVADIGDVLIKHLRRLIPTALCVFYLYDEETTELAASHVLGEQGEAIHGIRMPLGERLSGWVGANRQSIRNSDPVLDFGDTARTMKPRLRSCLSTPLVVADRLVGVLSLYAARPEAFSEEHQRLLEIVARQVAPVLKRSIEYARASVAAFRDPLTGLPNLEQLRQVAEDQDQSATLPVPTALLYVDVNDLKEVNTLHGRHVGDQVLREIVLQLTANLRAADVLFRLESDEFAILLLQTPRETATAIASRMKTSIQQSATTRMPLNVSVTVVAAPDDGDRIEALIASARKRMRSRQSGSHSGPSPSHNPESIH